MITSNDFRTGLTIQVDNDVWQVIDFQHVKPGKGAAFVRSKLKNMRTGAVQEKTFRAGEKMPRAHVETRKMQYLYNSADEYTFMDQESFEQLTLPGTKLERELNFLQENMTVSIMIYQGETIGIDLPNSVTLEVTETEPAVKGDTAQGATKAAILETGFSVQVPFFINTGDKLIIDTRTGDYVSRA